MRILWSINLLTNKTTDLQNITTNHENITL